MYFEWLIAASHLRSRRQDVGISLIAVLSTVGVTVGVAVLIIVLSVMEGFELDLRDKILGSNAHIVMLEYGGPMEDADKALDALAQTDGVVAAAPFVYSEVMLKSANGVSGAVMKGIDPERSGKVTDVAKDIKIGPRGEPADLVEKQAILTNLHTPEPAIAQDVGDMDVLPGMLLGEELAQQLRVYPGDRVFAINPIGGGFGALGIPQPTVRPFRVAGIFYTGMYEYDTKWAYVTIPDAQGFLQLDGEVTGVEVRVAEDRLFDAEQIGKGVEQTLGYPYFSKDWLTMNRPLFAALKLEKIVMGLILFCIVVVAALGIVTNLVVMVITRAREIAILRAMGATARSIRSIFIVEGVAIGVVGTSFGTVLGLAGCALLERYKFPLDTNVYYLDSLPVVVVPATVVVVAVGALVICFLATLYPSRRAAGIDPVDGLRYE